MVATGLRHLVHLQEDTATADEFGQMTGGTPWTTYASVKADIQPMRGEETMVAAQVQSDVKYRIRIHYRDDVTAEHRLLWGTRVFSITAVLHTGELGADTELLCVEQT